MAQRTLTAELRADPGSSAARRLRRTGRIPAVVYGHKENHLLSIDALEFGHKFKTVSESTIITLQTPDMNLDVLVKDFQEDILADRIVHIDFYEIERGKILKTHVHVRFLGRSVGEREGGILETFVHEVEVECLPKDLPEQIEYDISELDLGHSVHVRDLVPPEGVRILSSPDQTVCLVSAPKAEEVAEEEEEEEEILEGEEGEVAEEEEADD